MAGLSRAEIEDIQEVFDLFDFWDGRDGLMDAVKVPDVLRCADMNPTIAVCLKHGATKKPGEKQYKFDEFLPIYQSILKEKEEGTFADFMEAFKTFDREGQGFITAAELRAVLTSYGERLSDEQVDDIMKATKINIDRDGNVRFEDFIKIIPPTKQNFRCLRPNYRAMETTALNCNR
nr:myosin essential light chain [Hymenolepis microstoma]